MALVSAMWGIATLLALIWRVLPARAGNAGPSGPLPGWQLLLLAASVLTIFAGSAMKPAWANLGGIILALGLLALLCWREARAPARLLPRWALRLASPLCGLYIMMVLLIIGLFCDIFVPYFLQILHGQTPLMAGYMAASMSLGWTLAEIWSAGMRSRGAKITAIAGTVANLSGLTQPGGVSHAVFWLFAVFALAPLLAFICAIRIWH